MQNLFQNHPYSTRVGTLIERVTDSGKLAIDWTIVLEICDALVETDEGPREAIRAIRKRLTSSAGKDHISIWYTLILIEACLKNCGRRFQAQVANRDFLHDLIKVLLPKNNPPIQLQMKILYLIKSWVDASWDVPGRRDLEKVYTALRRKGVQFPSSVECQSLTAPQQASTTKRPVSSNSTSRSTKLASTFRRLTSGALGGDSRLKSITQSRSSGDDSRRSHGHQHQSSSTSHVQRIDDSDSPVTLRSVDGSHQIRVRTTASAGTLEPGTQVLQVVAINGYPVVTRNGQEVFFAATPRTFMNQVPPQQNQQHRCYQHQHHHNHGSPHAHGYSSRGGVVGDQTLVDQEGTVRRLSSAQRERLSQDLAVVQTNLHILNDMLTELQPDAISSDDLELLQELNETCRMMQQRVAEFLSQVADDAVTLTLIQLNDELNSAFQRYERFERYRLRAVRAQIAGRSLQAALPSTQSGGGGGGGGSGGSPHQLSIQQVSQPSGAIQTNQSQKFYHQQQHHQQQHHQQPPLCLPSTSRQKEDGEGNQISQNDGNNEDDDDDDELLDAVAEQAQRNPRTTSDPSGGELVSVNDWADNTLALQALRINENNWSTDPNTAQLERVFGSGFHALMNNPSDSQNSQSGLQALPGAQLEPLQPQPAVVAAPKAMSQPPIKKRTPSEVRRLEEALLLFDS